MLAPPDSHPLGRERKQNSTLQDRNKWYNIAIQKMIKIRNNQLYGIIPDNLRA